MTFVQVTRRIGAALIAVPLIIVAVPLALLSGLVTTFTGERRRHDRAWESMRDFNAEGLTTFQALCEERLLEATRASGASLADRQLRLTTFRFVEWRIDGTPLSIGIYPDGAGIWGAKVDDRFEEWDAQTPEELIEIVCEYAVRRAGAFRSGAV